MSHEATNPLRVSEVAKLLRVSEPTVRRMIDRGQLPIQHVGESIRVPQGEVERVLTTTERRGQGTQGTTEE